MGGHGSGPGWEAGGGGARAGAGGGDRAAGRGGREPGRTLAGRRGRSAAKSGLDVTVFSRCVHAWPWPAPESAESSTRATAPKSRSVSPLYCSLALQLSQLPQAVMVPASPKCESSLHQRHVLGSAAKARSFSVDAVTIWRACAERSPV